MLEPRKRTALDGKIWWCVFDTEAGKYVNTSMFFSTKYKRKKDCQYDIDLYEANNIDRYF